MANINIFALGGQDENGKDMYVIEVENDIYVINAGIKFPINDRWGVDGIIADTTYLSERKDRIKGVFLTHAHDESFAAIPWLLMDFPGTDVYSSEFTKEVAQERVSKYKIEHNKYSFNVLKEKDFGSATVIAHEVASSIPGAVLFEFKTVDGSIFFGSEMTIDSLNELGTTDLSLFDNKKVLALILDSRRANYSDKSADKKSIVDLVKSQFDNQGDTERIIVGAYDEEMFNIKEIIHLANEHNRPIAFYGSAYYSLFEKMKKIYTGVELPKNIISYKEISKHSNAVVLVTGTWSRIYQRFQRMATGNDVYLKFKPNDRVVMITPPRNGMEVEYSVTLDEITKIAPNIMSITDKDFYPLRPTKDDVKEIVSKAKPKYFIPISSLYRYQAEANNVAVDNGVPIANALLMNNGKVIYIKDGELASQKGRIKRIGDVIIQGFGVGDVSYEVLRERKSLAAGGLVSIAVQIDRRSKQLVGEINTQIVGLVVKTELNKYLELVNSIVIQKFEEAPKFDYRELQNAIRKRIQKQIRKFIDKEPLVVITFYEV